MLQIFYDSIQEGLWFQSLSSHLKDATLHPFPTSKDTPPKLAQALSFDRPDIILAQDYEPIMILERTVEVPSGHNVGQRFARLVAGAQMQIPVVYFGPYAAYKHGGKTQGPRYMNLRLFYALEKVEAIEDTVITIMNWPVDDQFEVIQSPEKDTRMIEYLNLFFRYYDGSSDTTKFAEYLKNSQFRAEQVQERQQFIKDYVRGPEQYDNPPNSVSITNWKNVSEIATVNPTDLTDKILLYNIGMKNIRSDPYTGTAILYAYLYCGGLTNRTMSLVLYFPNVTSVKWKNVAGGERERKDIRLFRLVADGILFSDGYIPKSQL